MLRVTTLPPAADEARDAAPAGPAAPDGPHRWLGQPELVVLGLLVLLLAQGWITGMLDAPAVRAWAAMFVAVVVQSLPFLVFGVVVAALISTFLSERLVRRVTRRPRCRWPAWPAWAWSAASARRSPSPAA